MICKYFLPLYGVVFSFWWYPLKRESLKFWWNLIHLFFFFFCLCLWCHLRMCCLAQCDEDFTCMFVSVLSFHVLHLGLWSIFTLRIVCGMEVFHFELFYIFWEFTAFKKMMSRKHDATESPRAGSSVLIRDAHCQWMGWWNPRKNYVVPICSIALHIIIR